MPGTSGDELAARIKEVSAETPVIMLTGFMDKFEIPLVDAILTKPATLASVRDAVTKVISSR
jgi:FixJ family two-component response regulator